MKLRTVNHKLAIPNGGLAPASIHAIPLPKAYRDGSYFQVAAVESGFSATFIHERNLHLVPTRHVSSIVLIEHRVVEPKPASTSE